MFNWILLCNSSKELHTHKVAWFLFPKKKNMFKTAVCRELIDFSLSKYIYVIEKVIGHSGLVLAGEATLPFHSCLPFG